MTLTEKWCLFFKSYLLIIHHLITTEAESLKHERILAEGLQEDGQIQVEESKAGDKVCQTHCERQNTGGLTVTGGVYTYAVLIRNSTFHVTVSKHDNKPLPAHSLYIN